MAKNKSIEVLLTAAQIKKRVKLLAKEISRDYKGAKLTVVPILKGSILFFSDLLRNLKVDCVIDFISVSSYKADRSKGIVRLLMDLRQSPQNKHILIVEDIVDTGYTLDYLCKNLKQRRPLSVRTCVLLDKPSLRKVPVKIDYKGFKVPDKFVVGYGLDYKEKYRNLPFIGILREINSEVVNNER
ncbi:MAG: hypoxanthine phosphoribosyltransferase [Elusimicrobia bacterium]|nr:hypoxanthine phosphoribosyltransferase [Candidatus Liberimonas magnetica]